MELIRLTKNNLLKKYGEAYIIAKVLNINISEVHYCLQSKGNKIKNTLRFDTNPSLGMKEIRGKIHLHDFADILYRGDIFDFVGIIYNLNSNEGFEFKRILSIIQSLMENDKPTINNHQVAVKKKVKKSKPTNISILSRPYSIEDDKYWLHIPRAFLYEKNIIPFTGAKYGNTNISINNKYGLAYAYLFDFHGEVQHIELYYPRAPKKYKFKNNMQRLKIPPNLKDSKKLILIKSYKDLTVLDYILESNKKSYAIIALPSEGYVLSKREYKTLSDQYDEIYMFNDFDEQGLTNMILHNIIFDIEPIAYVPKTIIEFEETRIKGIINKCDQYEMNISTRDIYDLIEIIKAIGIPSKHKDVYDNIKANKKNAKFLIERL